MGTILSFLRGGRIEDQSSTNFDPIVAEGKVLFAMMNKQALSCEMNFSIVWIVY